MLRPCPEIGHPGGLPEGLTSLEALRIDRGAIGLWDLDAAYAGLRVRIEPVGALEAGPPNPDEGEEETSIAGLRFDALEGARPAIEGARRGSPSIQNEKRTPITASCESISKSASPRRKLPSW